MATPHGQTLTVIVGLEDLFTFINYCFKWQRMVASFNTANLLICNMQMTWFSTVQLTLLMQTKFQCFYNVKQAVLKLFLNVRKNIWRATKLTLKIKKIITKCRQKCGYLIVLFSYACLEKTCGGNLIK